MKIKQNQSNFVKVGLLLQMGVALLGGLIVAYAMRWGPWAYSDSVGYFEVAHNLVVGNGPTQIKGSGGIMLLTTRPPFYSMVLATLNRLGLPLIDAARELNMILLAVFVFGIGLWLYLITRQLLLSGLVTVMLMSTPVMVYNFSGAMSEPLFFVLGFSGLFLLILYHQTHHQAFLWISAGLTSLAFVTRFTGVTFIATGSLFIALSVSGTFKKRLIHAGCYFLFALLPFIAWTIYLKIMGGFPGYYSIPSVHEMINLLRLANRSITETVIAWLPWGSALGARFPRFHATFLWVAVGLFVSWLGISIFRGGKKTHWAVFSRPSFQLGLVFSLFNSIYISFLVATYLFVLYPKPVLDVRMLSPILVGGILSGIGFVVALLGQRPSWNIYQVIPIGILLLFIAANLGPTEKYVLNLHQFGDGYTSQAWQESQVIQAVKKLPAGTRLISDDIDAIMFFTFRPASRIPELESSTPQPVNQRFGDDLSDSVQQLFKQRKAVLVLFNRAYWQFDAIYGGQGTQTRFTAFTNGLETVYTGSDGLIYAYPAP